MTRESDEKQETELVTPSGDVNEKQSAPQFVIITKTILSETSSSITWNHSPTTSKKFISQAEIDLISTTSDSDFMSPDLGKLCEKFLNL